MSASGPSRDEKVDGVAASKVCCVDVCEIDGVDKVEGGCSDREDRSE